MQTDPLQPQLSKSVRSQAIRPITTAVVQFREMGSACMVQYLQPAICNMQHSWTGRTRLREQRLPDLSHPEQMFVLKTVYWIIDHILLSVDLMLRAHCCEKGSSQSSSPCSTPAYCFHTYPLLQLKSRIFHCPCWKYVGLITLASYLSSG